METRSRKRAEASATAPSSSSSGPTTRAQKRSRVSAATTASSSTSTTATVAAPSIPNTRTTCSHSAPMEPSIPVESSSHSLRNKNESKGKEKEHDDRVREDKERDSLGLNADFGSNIPNDDDDNDSEGDDIGTFHHNLTSASSALQGLLRKLGVTGFDDLLASSGMPHALSSHQSGRLKKILSELRADGEEGKQVEALTQLCEMLSIGTEESLSTFSVDSYVPVLVGLLNHENNPDIMLLAARAITHLCDVLPSSCAAVVHYGAVSCFVARLLTIDYMDLAEQSLQALKNISQEHPTACLRAGALMAVLSYLDFFSTGVQRVALSTAANMCKKLPSDAADYVMEAVPLLTNLLQYHDAKVLEHASVCLTRISEAFASSADILDELCNHGLVAQAASLISTGNAGGGQTSLSPPIYSGLIRLLSTFASGSPLGAKTLLLLGISGTLKDILLGSGVSASASVPPALSRPAEQIFEIVNLANELLPPLPEGALSLPASSNMFVKGHLLNKSPSRSTGKQDNLIGNIPGLSAREKLLKDQPELLRQFGMDLLPVLIEIYGSSVNGPVRHKCLSVIGKLMYFSSAEMIQSLLSVTNLSCFLAGVLAWKDPHVLVSALKIAEILMEKLPGTFAMMFIREGVVHAVDQLILNGNLNAASAQASNAEKGNNSVSRTSSHSRRYKRFSGSFNVSEESKNPIPSTIGSHPNSIEIPTVSSNLHVAVSARAEAFKLKYFPSDPGSTEVGVTGDLLKLKSLCMKLNSGVDDDKTKRKGKSKTIGARNFENSASKEEYLIGVISEILSELKKGDGVSTFEFIGSGVVAALLNYFSCGHFSKGRISEANLSTFRQQVLKRFKLFISLALPSNIDDVNASYMTVLVQKLQNALSSLERFPVVLNHLPRSSTGSARLSTGLSALSQPFKLRLCRAQGEKSLRDHSSNLVYIDPLASIADVEIFLWSRVQQKPSALVGNSESGTTHSGADASSPFSTPLATRRSLRSRSSLDIGDSNRKQTFSLKRTTSTSKGKGKAISKPTQEESKGPQTRFMTPRKASVDKEAKMKSVNGDSSPEDEGLDISAIEIDDALVIEDDVSDDDEDDDHVDFLRGSLPLGMLEFERVHDVKLADVSEDSCGAPGTSDSQNNPASSSCRAATLRGSGSNEFRGGGSYGPRGALSFSAAAMANLETANGRGFRSKDRLGRHLLGSSSDGPKLILTAGGKMLDRHLTIFQAIQRYQGLNKDGNDGYVGSDFISSDGSRLWSDTYTITYQKADGQLGSLAAASSNSATASKSAKSGFSKSISDTQLQHMSLLDSILQAELPCDMEKSNPTYNILALLRVLEGLNQLAPRLRAQLAVDNFNEAKVSILNELNPTGATVAAEEFINSKVTPKLARQIQDALALCSVSLPSWCYQLTKACPFLFSFETRRQYFHSTAIGLSRALYRLQLQHVADGNLSMTEKEARVVRLQRQKVRVSRNRILDSAAKVMEMYSSQKAVLEVEYFGEVGTGLGPTLEFYTLLSHDLQKASLGMWRSTSSYKYSMKIDNEGNKVKKSNSFAGDVVDDEVVQAPLGLFPRPWPPCTEVSEGSHVLKVVENFRLLGRVMAKALQDGRLLDLPLSIAFYKLVLGQELDLYDILSFDVDLGKVLQEFQGLVCRKCFMEPLRSNCNAVADLEFRGTPIEDLCLDFGLPGYPDYILKPGDESVDKNNLEEYVSLVVDATVKTGIMRQMEAFRDGFNQVFDIASLQIFSPYELDYLLCGRRELWEPDTLGDHIKFDHGYTAKSPAIVNLLEIMGEFTPEQQRAFCQFVTGAPRLPPGGLAALKPKLTVVRKHSSSSVNRSANGSGALEYADEDLPSVMTCANYLKLPPYSTKEVMYKKLLYAINEGQGSFDLS